MPETMQSRLLEYQQLLDHSFANMSSRRAERAVKAAYAQLAPALSESQREMLKHPRTLQTLLDHFVAVDPKLIQAIESYKHFNSLLAKNPFDLSVVNRWSAVKTKLREQLPPHEYAMLNDKEGIATLIDAHRHNTRDRLIPKPPEVNVTSASKPEPVNNLPQQLRDYQREQQALEATATSVEQAAAALPTPLLKELGIDAARIPQDVQGIEALIGKLQQHPEHKAALKPVIEKLGTLHDSHERMSNLLEVLVPQLEAKKIHPDALADAKKLQVLLNSHPLQTPVATAAIPAVEINAAITQAETTAVKSLTVASKVEEAAAEAVTHAPKLKRASALKRTAVWMGGIATGLFGLSASPNSSDFQSPKPATASFDPSAPGATPVKIEILAAEEHKPGKKTPTAAVSPAPKEPPRPPRKREPLQALPTEPHSPVKPVTPSQPLISEPPAAMKAAESAAEAATKKSGGKAKWVLGGIGVAAVAIGAIMAMNKGESKDNGQSASR